MIGHGPVAEFARGFAKVLLGDDDRTLDEVAKGGNCGTSTVHDACAGRKLPTEGTVRACLVGIGAADEVINRWLRRRADTAKAAEVYRPSFAGKVDNEDLAAALRLLVEQVGLDLTTLHRRIQETNSDFAAADDPGRERRSAHLLEEVPTRAELASFLEGRTGVTSHILHWVLFAAGATVHDRNLWAKNLKKVLQLAEPAETEVRPPEPPIQPPVPGAPERDRRPLLLILSSIGVMVLGVLGIQPFLRHTERSASPASTAVGGSSAKPILPAVDGVLGELAGRVCARGGVATPLPFMYIRRTSWSVETTGGGHHRTTVDESTWWSPADRSGIRKTQRTGPNGLTFPGTERFGPGQFMPPFDGELSTDPVTFIEQITVNHPARVGPARVVRGVAEFSDHYVPTAAQQCTLLRALAEAPDLTFRDQAVDERDRPGIAISGDDTRGLAREELVIDAESGDILAYNSYDLRGETPVKIASVTYVERRFVGGPG